MLSIQELRSSSKKELLLELQKARKEMLKIRINLKTKHEKDTSKARKEKRMIAQILTLLKEFDKEPSSAKASEAPTKKESPVAKPEKSEVLAPKPEAKKPAVKKAVAKKTSKKNS